MRACSFSNVLKLFGALSLFLFICASSANATLIYNINFSINYTMDGTSAGVTVAPVTYAGTTWNDIDYGGNIGGTVMNVSIYDILDSEGGSSSIDFITTSNGIWEGDAVLAALKDYIYTYDYEGDGDPARTFTFAGMDSLYTYDIYFLSNGDTDTQLPEITINGVTQSTSDNDGNSGNDSLADLTSWYEGNNYLVFSGLTPDASGTITGTYSAVNTFGPISGIQIVAAGPPVPEPATMLLFGTGLAGLAGARLRRRKK